MPGAGAERRAEQGDDVLSQNATAAQGVAASGPAASAPTQDVSSDMLLERVLSSLDDDKAVDVVTIDLRGKSSIADHMVICSGRSARQVGAIAEKLVERLKEAFGRGARVEGKETGDWVLVDAGDVIVHVFRPEVREFYQLEKMWLPPVTRTGAGAGAGGGPGVAEG